MSETRITFDVADTQNSCWRLQALVYLSLLIGLMGLVGCETLWGTSDPTVHTGKTVKISCVGCHRPNYDSAKSPDHTALQLSMRCESCHVKAAWRPAKWPHLTWPLEGAHQQAACAKCHGAAPNRVAKPPRDCAGCHLSNYQATSKPDHVASGFSQACASCHSVIAWKPATFSHETWPLEGGHKQVACAKCHGAAPNRVAKPPRDCAGCHLSNYQATSKPNHVASGFPQACATCHTVKSWKPATWSHSTWPLEGKHQQVTCAKCHGVTPNRVPKPSRDCVGCHLTNYQATSNPNHVSSGFPKACASCHTTNGWKPATFGAHKFPISSGKHSAIACSTCHIDSTNIKLFSCVSGGCHSKASTDNEHIGEVSGYVYKSSACLSCHPSGDSD